MSYASLGLSSQPNAFLQAMAEVQSEFPTFRITRKRDSGLMRAVDVLLKVITLGTQNKFLTQYHTTLGDTLYVGDDWDQLDDTTKAIVLRHELVHLRQEKAFGRIGYAVTYLFFVFPVGLAYGRALIEWQAYSETIRATLELKGKDAVANPALRKQIVSQFTGPSYLWMWPFKNQIESWYDQALQAAGVH
jgi:hypothetical protein